MIKVTKEMCRGCGICAESCPRAAISLRWGYAEIDQNRCNKCRLCLDICPQRAIVEVIPVSIDELITMVTSLKHKTSDLIDRIETLKNQAQ